MEVLRSSQKGLCHLSCHLISSTYPWRKLMLVCTIFDIRALCVLVTHTISWIEVCRTCPYNGQCDDICFICFWIFFNLRSVAVSFCLLFYVTDELWIYSCYRINTQLSIVAQRKKIQLYIKLQIINNTIHSNENNIRCVLVYYNKMVLLATSSYW